MKSEIVPFCGKDVDSACVRLDVDIFKWQDNRYRPKTQVFLSYDMTALHIRMISSEKETLVRTVRDNGPVWCDSCMEMFIRPFGDDARYMNFEINPAGAMVMGIHLNRREKTELILRYKCRVNPVPFSDSKNGSWGVVFTVPFAMLCEIYGRECRFGSGSIIRANFYKCGDETRYPHFGMWNEIESEVPDFHMPEYFGRLQLQ